MVKQMHTNVHDVLNSNAAPTHPPQQLTSNVVSHNAPTKVFWKEFCHVKAQDINLTSSEGRGANGFMTAARGTWDCLAISEVHGIL